MSGQGSERGGRGIWFTPRRARIYLLLSFFFLALPTLSELYQGQTGRFLVATDHLNGTFFEHTVIYVEDHDLFKATGYIVNRPLSGQVAGRFVGGPVRGDMPSAMKDNHDAPSGFSIVPVFEPEADAEKIFMGYAGWTLVQLDYEILRGRWYTLDYDPDLMFRTPPDQMWGKAYEKLGVPVPAVLARDRL